VPGFGNLLHEVFGPQLGEIVAQRGQAILLRRNPERRPDVGIEFRGLKRAAGGEVSEPYQDMHQGQLPGMVEFETRDALAILQNRGLGELSQLAAIDEGLQNVLLHVEVAIEHGIHPGAEGGKMLDGLFHPIVGDIVGRRLGAQQEVIPYVLLDESVAVVAADDGVGEIEVFDHRLQLAAVALADLAAKDGGDLMRLADGAIGVQEALFQSVQASAAAEDEIVAILDLGKEQAM
jgi:hypothetical protein